MNPIFLAVLTVFIIGIVSFLIGWWLTSTKWKGQYFREEQKRKIFEKKTLRLESSLQKAEEVEQEQRDRINSLHGDIRRLAKEVKNYQRDKEKHHKSKQVAIQSPEVTTTYNSLMNELNSEKKKNGELKKQIARLRRNIRTSSNGEDHTNDPTSTPNLKEHRITREIRSSRETTKSSMTKENIEQIHLKSILERIAIFSNPEQTDDLSLIQGIGEKVKKQMNSKGFYSYKQIAMLTDRDLRIICEILQLPKDKGIQENWSAQANQLYYKKYG